MALRRVVAQLGWPLAAHIPNAETIAALKEPTNNLRQFDSVEDLFADIEVRQDARTQRGEPGSQAGRRPWGN